MKERKKSMKRIVIFTLILALMLATPMSAFGLDAHKNDIGKPGDLNVSRTAADENEATVLIRSDTGQTILFYTVTWDDGDYPTAADAMVTCLIDEGIPYIVDGDGYISSINGIADGSKGQNSGWMWGYNGAAANVGSDDYTIKDGDVLLFKFVTDWKKFGTLNDINSSWAKEKILMLKAYDIVNGVTFTVNKDYSVTGKYMPTKNVTRAEFVQVLYNMVADGTVPTYKATFKDVKQGAWYTNAIIFMSDYGIVTGAKNKDGTYSFNPNANITRQDMAVILYRFWYGTSTAPEVETSFADNSSISGYAKGAVAQMSADGIINGYNENGKFYFKPKKNANRAEMASMIYPLAATLYGF